MDYKPYSGIDAVFVYLTGYTMSHLAVYLTNDGLPYVKIIYALDVAFIAAVTSAVLSFVAIIIDYFDGLRGQLSTWLVSRIGSLFLTALLAGAGSYGGVTAQLQSNVAVIAFILLLINSHAVVPVASCSGIMGDIAGCIAASNMIGDTNIGQSTVIAIGIGFFLGLFVTVVIVLFYSIIIHITRSFLEILLDDGVTS